MARRGTIRRASRGDDSTSKVDRNMSKLRSELARYWGDASGICDSGVLASFSCYSFGDF